MTRKIVATAVVVTMVFALSIDRASAKSDKESCKGTTMNVTKTNADGTTCAIEVLGGESNKASATASGDSTADAKVEDGIASAKASKGSVADASAEPGKASATSSGEGTFAEASTSSGKATAKATGTNALANSEIDGTGGGLAEATADSGVIKDSTADSGSGAPAIPQLVFLGGIAEAFIQGDGGGTAIADEKNQGTAIAEVETDGGTAKAAANGADSEADADAEVNCNVKSTATGAESEALGACFDSGSVVTVEATKGSTANGSDIADPICTPTNGGIARVRSPFGNCG